MKITADTVFSVALPLPEAYGLSGGRSFGAVDSTVVKLETDAGIAGWAEACPVGKSCLPGHPRGIRTALAEPAPARRAARTGPWAQGARGGPGHARRGLSERVR